ncbi:MAG: gliding motility-associated C-terminal domain-containing protein [Cyclobacteriaceae bacterium]
MKAQPTILKAKAQQLMQLIVLVMLVLSLILQTRVSKASGFSGLIDQQEVLDLDSVETLPGLTVGFNTAFGSLPLPTKVVVMYSDKQVDLVSVRWWKSNYNGAVSGTYEMVGDLLIPKGTLNSKFLKAVIEITVARSAAPTGIVLSDSIFAVSGLEVDPDGTIGIFSTNDPNAMDEFTYRLVNGTGDDDNCKFRVVNGILTYRSVEGLGDQTEFTIRVSSTDLAGNTIEKIFHLYIGSDEKEKETFTIPNTFSPNGDGVNDTWTIPSLKDHTGIEIKVYDRAGFLVYSSTDPMQGWTGTNSHGRVIPGIYYYVVVIGDLNKSKKGTLLLIL